MREQSMSHGGTARSGPDEAKIIEKFVSNRGSKEFSLDKVQRLVELIGKPHEAFPVFHIAGTNGKGSVSCAIAAMLGANQKKVVLTISPHLVRVNERVIIDGIPIDDTVLAGHLRLLESASESIGVVLSLHEAMTVVALLEGKEAEVDYGVLEVGVGGRLDTTNIAANPAVGIITSVSFDHTELLGNQLELIAREKAGIIKKTMKAVVVGAVSESVRLVIELQATAAGVPVLAFGRDFWVDSGVNGSHKLHFDGKTYLFSPRLAGAHQVHNAALALVAAIVEGLDPLLSIEGLSHLFWPARLEQLSCFETRTVILDSAHNPDGVKQVATFVENTLKQSIDCVFGSLNTKDWRSMIDVLYPITRHWYLLAPPGESAVPSETISEYLSGFGITSYLLRDEEELFEQFLKEPIGDKTQTPPLVVLGSMYLIGSIRKALALPEKPYWKVGNT
jgi:dihydrofolate synthase/folylpolyglutamate synthase